jgi:hypothetical protein
MMAMQVNYQLTGTIEVPEGATLNSAGTAIILPSGESLKLWEAWEVHHAGEDDHTDPTYEDLVKLGIHYDTLSISFEEA